MSSRNSAKYKQCSTTAWVCFEKSNHEKIIDIQGILKKSGKRWNMDEAVNFIISAYRLTVDKNNNSH